MNYDGTTINPTETDNNIPGTFAHDGNGVPIFTIHEGDLYAHEQERREEYTVKINDEVYAFNHNDSFGTVVFRRAFHIGDIVEYGGPDGVRFLVTDIYEEKLGGLNTYDDTPEGTPISHCRLYEPRPEHFVPNKPRTINLPPVGEFKIGDHVVLARHDGDHHNFTVTKITEDEQGVALHGWIASDGIPAPCLASCCTLAHRPTERFFGGGGNHTVPITDPARLLPLPTAKQQFMGPVDQPRENNSSD